MDYPFKQGALFGDPYLNPNDTPLTRIDMHQGTFFVLEKQPE